MRASMCHFQASCLIVFKELSQPYYLLVFGEKRYIQVIPKGNPISETQIATFRIWECISYNEAGYVMSLFKMKQNLELK